MTVAVRPELPFGIAVLGAGDTITGFREKPRAEHWLNGGFIVCEPEFAGYLRADAVLERARSSGVAATAACTRSGTRASGPAWTPTRTWSP